MGAIITFLQTYLKTLYPNISSIYEGHAKTYSNLILYN